MFDMWGRLLFCGLAPLFFVALTQEEDSRTCLVEGPWEAHSCSFLLRKRKACFLEVSGWVYLHGENLDVT